MLIDRRAKSDSTCSASVMYSGFMQPSNSSHTMGSCYLEYGLVLYSPIIYHPVRILGNDYPGMGTVARLLYACSMVVYICTWEHVRSLNGHMHAIG